MKNRHLIVLIELLKDKYFDDYVLKSVLIMQKMIRICMLFNTIKCLLILLDQESGLAPSLKGTLQRFEENEISQL